MHPPGVVITSGTVPGAPGGVMPDTTLSAAVTPRMAESKRTTWTLEILIPSDVVPPDVVPLDVAKELTFTGRVLSGGTP